MAAEDRSTTTATHLLVVEDDAEIGMILRRYFEAQGFRISLARDGGQMRACLAADAVQLVMLDLGLPGEDGLELTRYLRAHWHGPIIIVTGRGDAVDRVVGLELGADDYVTKPFDLRELLARVRSVLRRSAAVAEPAARLTICVMVEAPSCARRHRRLRTGPASSGSTVNAASAICSCL